MRLLAIAMLAAVLGAGCAFEAGDPGAGTQGQDPSGSTLSIGQGRMPKAHSLAAAPQGAASAGTMDNPDPAPWMVGSQATTGAGSDSTGTNPDPAPWRPDDTVQSYGSQTQPSGTPGGSTGGSTNTAQGHTPRIRHWDVKQAEEAQ